MLDAVWKLRLETLEQIEACGSSIIRQASHLSQLLAVADDLTVECDRAEVSRLLATLEQAVAAGCPDQQAACLTGLRLALRVPSLPAPPGSAGTPAHRPHRNDERGAMGESDDPHGASPVR